MPPPSKACHVTLAAILAALLIVAPPPARAQGPAALTRFGSWFAGMLYLNGHPMCTAGARTPSDDLLQVIRMKIQGTRVLALNIVRHGVVFAKPLNVSIVVGDRIFRFEGQPSGSDRTSLGIYAQTASESQMISDAIQTLVSGREVVVIVGPAGSTSPIQLSLSGAGAAITEMEACAQREGMLTPGP